MIKRYEDLSPELQNKVKSLLNPSVIPPDRMEWRVVIPPDNSIVDVIQGAVSPLRLPVAHYKARLIAVIAGSEVTYKKWEFDHLFL